MRKNQILYLFLNLQGMIIYRYDIPPSVSPILSILYSLGAGNKGNIPPYPSILYY